jgi:KDO2-lipid IV(A) lauroyltransferase
MSLVKTFNNKYLLQGGIKLCQWVPRLKAMAAIEVLSSMIARFKNSDLIKAIKINQKVISERPYLTPSDLDVKTQAVIKHALLCYYDFFHTLGKPEEMSSLFPTAVELHQKFIRATRAEGALVIAPHISNFNLIFQVITENGFRAKLLTLSALFSGYDLINNIRSRAGAEIVPVDQGRYFQETVEYLKSGGIAVTAIDRPVPIRKPSHRVKFFGKPSALPVGYISLARAANVPIIIVTAYMTADGNYDFRFSEKIYLTEYQNKLEDLINNGEVILKRIAEIIRLAPEQWLMYYPVWPDLTSNEL